MEDTTDKASWQSVDPWLPIPTTGDQQLKTGLLTPPGDNRGSLDSERYLALIESKLNRLKGINCKKEPAAKDIINGLDKMRLCHMRMLTDIDLTMPYVRNSDYVDESASSPTVVDLLKRRIAPEKQAISEEELKKLVENDELLLTSLAAEQAQDANDVACANDSGSRLQDEDVATDNP